MLLSALTCATGCRLTSGVQGLREYHDGLIPIRSAKDHAPFLHEGTEPNPDYFVESDDAVELEASPDAPLKVTITRLIGDAPPFLSGLSRARIPAFALLPAESRTLKVDKGRAGCEQVRLGPTPERNTVPVPQRWSEITKLLEPLARCGLAIRFVPGERTWIKPGDTVVLYRMSRDADAGEGAKLRSHVEHQPLTVDSQGQLWIPPLKTAINTPPAKIEADPAQRMLLAAVDRMQFRVQVWSPGTSYESTLTLDQLSRCLSAVPFTKESPAPEECRRTGVDAGFAPQMDVLSLVRYAIEPPAQTWTLVNDRGDRFSMPFRRGETVAAAVRSGYVRLTGTELTHRSLYQTRAFITVIPDSHWGTADERFPFYASVDPFTPSPLDSALLLPGDVVFASHSYPNRLPSAAPGK